MRRLLSSECFFVQESLRMLISYLLALSGGGGGGTQTGTGMSAAKLDAETEELKRARRAPREPRPLLRRTPAAPTSRLPPASR